MGSSRHRTGRVDIGGGAKSEITALTMTSRAGLLGSMEIDCPDAGSNAYQIMEAFIDSSSITGTSNYITISSADNNEYIFWFNNGRLQLQTGLDLTIPYYGFYDIQSNGTQAFFVANNGSAFEAWTNDGVGNFSQTINWDFMNSISDCYFSTVTGVSVFNFTTDGNDIWTAQYNGDFTFQDAVNISGTGWSSPGNVTSVDVDGDTHADTITGYDMGTGIFSITLTRYGGATQHAPGIVSNEHEVGIYNTDSTTEIAAKLDFIINTTIFGTVNPATQDSNVVTVTDYFFGQANDPTSATASIDVEVFQYGSLTNINSGDFVALTGYQLSGTTAVGFTLVIWFNVDGGGGDPELGDYEVEIDVSSGDSSDTIAANIYSSCTTGPNGSVLGQIFTIITGGGESVEFINILPGVAGFISVGGVGGEITAIGQAAGYIGSVLLNTPSTNYYVWFKIGALNSSPALSGKTAIQANCNYADSTTAIATAVKNAINLTTHLTATSSGSVVTVTNISTGAVAHATTNISGSQVTISVIQSGS